MGVIAPDYCDKVGVVLFNNNAKETFHIEKGDKIAQLIVKKIDDTPLKPVTTLDATQRGTQGFGSTGDKKRTTPTASNRPDPPTQKKEGTTQNQTMESSTQPCMECTSKQCTPCMDKKRTTQGPKTSMLATEMWHQRMGHIGLKKLQDTAKCTKGMPSIGQLHPLFKCRACAIAKMTKTPRRKMEQQASKPGELFHMDFRFVRGPKNLQTLLQQQRTAKHKIRHAQSHHPIKTSHNGYTSYLLITDAASPFTWIFLSKTKDPPIQVLDLFLQCHGLKEDMAKYVQTD